MNKKQRLGAIRFFNLYGYNETTKRFQDQHDLLLSPDDISKTVDAIATDIVTNFGSYFYLAPIVNKSKPDFMPFASDLESALKEKDCYVQQAPLYITPKEDDKKPIEVSPLAYKLSGKKLLIVDSGFNHGIYDFLRAHLESLGAGRVHVAAFVKNDENTRAEYFGLVENTKWLEGYGFGIGGEQQQIKSLYKRTKGITGLPLEQ